MYSNTGKELLHNDRLTGQRTSVAQAMDNEAAHALATAMNERSPNFIRDAMVTCSPMFHADMVADAEFRGAMANAIDALNHLDKVKKSLFYGRDNNLIADGQTDVSDLLVELGTTGGTLMSRPAAINIIHAILGIATEAGELLEALREGYNGNGFDWVNIKEEAGDLAWYEALLADTGDYSFEEVQQLIIRKLKTRFADKFSAAEANERNLDAERTVLEGGFTGNELGAEGGMMVEPPVAMISYPVSDIQDAIDLCDKGTEAHGDEFYGPIRAILQPVTVMEATSIGDPDVDRMEGGSGELGAEEIDGDYDAPADPTAAPVPGLKPSEPASGKSAVKRAEAESNQAFANVGNVRPKVEPETPTNSELAKSPAERLNPLPGEATAQQNAKGIPDAK